MAKQVSKDHSRFETYTGFDRWTSYYHQVREILAVAPDSVLEIGTGDGFLKRFVQASTPISYLSLDIAADLEPDIVGSVVAIPLGDDSVDISVACEVLEHLPFEKFANALREMKRVSRRYVLISLPHFGPKLKLAVKLPATREVQLAVKVPFPREHVFLGEHYWEIGKRGYSIARVRSVLRELFTVEKDFIPFESQYHHFFLLRK